MSILGSKQTLGLAAILLVIGNLLSRLMGLIRDKVISWQFGAGSEADLYFAAFVIPDMINYLLAASPCLLKAFKKMNKMLGGFFQRF